MTAQYTHHPDFNAQHDCIANTYTFYTNLWSVVTVLPTTNLYVVLVVVRPAMPQPQHSKLSPFNCMAINYCKLEHQCINTATVNHLIPNNQNLAKFIEIK